MTEQNIFVLIAGFMLGSILTVLTIIAGLYFYFREPSLKIRTKRLPGDIDIKIEESP